MNITTLNNLAVLHISRRGGGHTGSVRKVVYV